MLRIHLAWFLVIRSCHTIELSLNNLYGHNNGSSKQWFNLIFPAKTHKYAQIRLMNVRNEIIYQSPFFSRSIDYIFHLPILWRRMVIPIKKHLLVVWLLLCLEWEYYFQYECSWKQNLLGNKNVFYWGEINWLAMKIQPIFGASINYLIQAFQVFSFHSAECGENLKSINSALIET